MKPLCLQHIAFNVLGLPSCAYRAIALDIHFEIELLHTVVFKLDSVRLACVTGQGFYFV